MMGQSVDYVELLTSLFGTDASYAIGLKRNENDEFVVNFDPIRESANLLAKADLLALLPRGSHWSQAIGWHSYVGISFVSNRREWTLVGLQMIHKHPTRGAYPVFTAYIYPSRSFPFHRLEELAGKLTSTSGLYLNTSSSGAVCTHSNHPDQHRSAEAMILRAAANRYSSGCWTLFRTLVLSEAEFTSLPVIKSARPLRGIMPLLNGVLSYLGSSEPRLQIKDLDFLVGISISIQREFSSRTVRLIQAISLDRWVSGSTDVALNEPTNSTENE